MTISKNLPLKDTPACCLGCAFVTMKPVSLTFRCGKGRIMPTVKQTCSLSKNSYALFSWHSSKYMQAAQEVAKQRLRRHRPLLWFFRKWPIARRIYWAAYKNLLAIYSYEGSQ